MEAIQTGSLVPRGPLFRLRGFLWSLTVLKVWRVFNGLDGFGRIRQDVTASEGLEGFNGLVGSESF